MKKAIIGVAAVGAIVGISRASRMVRKMHAQCKQMAVQCKEMFGEARAHDESLVRT